MSWLEQPNFLLVINHWCYIMVKFLAKLWLVRSPSLGSTHTTLVMIWKWLRTRYGKYCVLLLMLVQQFKNFLNNQLQASMKKCLLLRRYAKYLSHGPSSNYILHPKQKPFRFKDAWSFAAALDTVDSWTALAEMAVQHLDIDFGIAEWTSIFTWYITPQYIQLFVLISKWRMCQWCIHCSRFRCVARRYKDHHNYSLLPYV